MRESERWCKITAPRHDDALTCQIDLLRGDAVGTGKEGRIRSPGQPQTDRQTGGLSVTRETERFVDQTCRDGRSTLSPAKPTSCETTRPEGRGAATTGAGVVSRGAAM